MSKSILCIGATLVDELYFSQNTIIPNSSNPAQKSTSIGGVISNIAQHLALLGLHPSLITVLGKDSEANSIAEQFNKLGISFSESNFDAPSTGKYVSIAQPDGTLYVSVCQDTTPEYLSIPFLESKSNFIKDFDLILLDANSSAESLQWMISFAKANHQKLIIEPVSVSKAKKLAALDLNGVYMITPNQEELHAIATIDSEEESVLVSHLLQRGVEKVWLRKGSQGSVVFDANNSLELSVPTISIIDSTGAGDAALAAWVFGYCNQENERSSLQLAHSLAMEVLQIKGAVVTSITADSLQKIKNNYYHD
jgi:pseudouridine kinase